MSWKFAATTICPTAADEPVSEVLRGEPFSVEHLQQHAHRLAAEMGAGHRDRGDPALFADLEANGRLLRDVHRELLVAVERGEPITPDAEWLLDNFSVVEEQLREIREDLPQGYYRDLPKAAGGRPRVYFLSLELIIHTDSLLDEETLVRFLQAFQETAPLSIGEIWAVPIMLRLALVENLRRLAMQLRANRRCRAQAGQIIERLQAGQATGLELASLDQCAPVVLELIEVLQEPGGDYATRLKELERELAERGVDNDHIVRLAHQRQAANQVSIGNVITSMRLISALDWMALFERTSLTEQALRHDPAGIYPRMDAATRDRYRHEIELLSKRGQRTEPATAEEAVRLAREAVASQRPVHEHHVGYYLIDAGRDRLERELVVKLDLAARLRRAAQLRASTVYLGSVTIVMLLVVLALAAATIAAGVSGWVTALLAALAVLPASELAVSLTNLVITRVFPPKCLPKLEFRDGVPPDAATLVVVPALLTSPREVQSLFERLELHYLGNPEPHLRFALVTDFADAREPLLPHDQELLADAVARIETLNQRYGMNGDGPFLLLHRQRRWNAAEGCWMGWERKRGKLMQLNRLLASGHPSPFPTIAGNAAAVAGKDGRGPIRFVITLDADTQLPPGSARRLIGTLAHPLNQPRWADSWLAGGYAICQPRVGVHLPSANRSWYARIFANSPGLDPYATAASDVYQDLFGEGSFTGKGIYDVAAFEAALAGVFPENYILSHDLIEGCHSRVGLVSDIELIDGFPARYDAEARRQHRWVRGDWQLLPWLMPRVPSESGWRPNRLSLLSRWKIFDNLRRSLVAPLLLALLAIGCVLAAPLAPLWVGVVLAVLGFPLLVQVLATLSNWPRALAWSEYRRAWTGNVLRSLAQTAIQIAFLPYRAWTMADAVLRTLVRLTMTRRHLLEWETAAATEQRLSQSGWTNLTTLWFSPLFATALLIALPLSAKLWTAPLIAAWLGAPLLAWWLSQPIETRLDQLSDGQRKWLRGLVLRTWLYFERFVTAEDNWMPPDNFQEYPAEKVAHRISPTNEGLFLLSALIARDFGLISLGDLVTLWERNLESWGQLGRLRGHFYNWYDTTTLQPLQPRYLSTVDSGNLAACFLTLRQGIDELREQPLFGPRVWQGVLDRVAAIEAACQALHPRGARLVSPPLVALQGGLANLAALDDPPDDLAAWRLRLRASREELELVVPHTEELVRARTFPWSELPDLVAGLKRLIDGLDHDFQSLFAWEADLAKVPDLASEHTAARPLLDAITTRLAATNNVRSLAALADVLGPEIARLRAIAMPAGRTMAAWITTLEEHVAASSTAARQLDSRLSRLAEQMEAWTREMDFAFLYNRERRLFSIGFNIEDGQLDRAHYDMLASEARVASYLAIAKGDVDHRTWFRMSRPMAEMAGRVGLLSWGGTMFEYLMPQLFQRQYAGSLLAESCRAAVLRQIEFGRQQHLPWGVSESAFSALAANADYHYRSFGVPGLGLKRGLAKDLVVSPYSTFLALEQEPVAAYDNLQLLASEGGLGRWGYFDALDYTPERLPADKRCLPVRCYMAHHQGMSLAALANLLDEGSVQRRFHAHPLGRAVELLLQERVPTVTPLVEVHESQAAAVELPRAEVELVSRRMSGYETATPRTHLLSNGQYSVMLTSTGGGYAKLRDLAVTRWRSDPTCDAWGQFLYLRDVRSGRVWSATYQPTRAVPDAYHVTYSIDKAEYHRRDGVLETNLEVAVSPESPAEMRQLKLTNYGQQAAEIEITSYAEIVLASSAADEAHPAFHKLFIETEYVAEELALLARRRPRDASQRASWAVHVLAPGVHGTGGIEFESSREKFLGRGRTMAAPAALDADVRLSHTTGAVLDPVLVLRTRVVIAPNETATLAFTTAVATSREEALALADQFHELRVVQRAFEMAWAFSQVELRHLHLSPARAHLFQRLASALVYPDPAWRADAATLAANRQGQSGLWRYGISGDLPLLLAHVTRPDQLDVVRDLLVAHQYWRAHGLNIDLAIINEHPGSYLDALQEQLVALVGELHRQPEGQAAHVYLLRGAQLPREDQTLLAAAASVVVRAERGTLAKQVEWAVSQAPRTTAAPAALRLPREPASGKPQASKLLPAEPKGSFYNGLGGFIDGDGAYRIDLSGGRQTPEPWSNVIANPRFGCLVTESGGGYTWAENSREYKLTSWANDPVADPPAEWLYVRDERSGVVYRPLPQPGRDPASDYVVEHRPGQSRFRCSRGGLEFETQVSVAADDPVKFVRVSVHNRDREAKALALTYYVEWVLGVHRRDTQLHLVSSLDAPSGALLARNRYHPVFPEHIAFLNVLGPQRSSTADRTEFLGRNRDALEPAAIVRASLSGQTGAGLDPCGAVQARLGLAAGERGEVVFLLGAGRDLEEVRTLLTRYSSSAAVTKEVHRQCDRWDEMLSAIQVCTPNPALDVLVNRWLIYQTLSCRLWARSAYYQSGGAYGFRDQLQDVMALVYCRPDLAREHLLRAASRQYEEGDVQHWWHPPQGRGTRTRFSDDYLWLPLVTCHYVRVTGDRTVLDEPAPLLISPLLEAREHERYELPQRSPHAPTLYEHCRLMFQRAFRLGPHGLPLMGCGDWNDGMNKVGELGQGESVWVGWFLLAILREFLPVMRERGDLAAADHLAAQARQLRQNLETHAWDGQWYRRAYFDDGTPLGSQLNDECRIDSISQSWAVFAGADRGRVRLAMDAVWQELVRERARLVLLLAPPFDKSSLDPGYIKGYLPGIRENGGQYTHAALWTVQAFAQLGDAERAMELLDLINPVLHADTPEGVVRYQVEPYVAAADVYGVPPHTGRGGWTWYTGSASWMYRVVVETILGFELRGNRLRIRPCVPADWPKFEITYRRGGTHYNIVYLNGPHRTEPRLWLDGERLAGDEIELAEQSSAFNRDDQGRSHEIVIDCSASQAIAPQTVAPQIVAPLSEGGIARSAASRVG